MAFLTRRQPELSVLEISAQCGYGDVSNFVRRFRGQFGVTPLQFRQQQRGGQAASACREKTGASL